MEKQPVGVKAVFDRALEIETATERNAYLDEACADAPEIRQQVEALLKAHADAGSFLQKPAPDLGATMDSQPGEEVASATKSAGPRCADERPGRIIGPYKLLQQIGEGGMGTVFMAEQTRPVQRMVALKIIKAGMDSHQVIARFEAERQALALMDHPNIARVLDAGTTDAGQPYFVMELVKGVLITKYCDEHHLTPRERLELFLPVCQAVQHAHQKGIIHRDIKPSNVMVCLYDNKPVPKVIDFGIAKATAQRLTDRTLFTEFGAVVGTLEYMSPEQAGLNQMDIDTRSDIFSLGVLLYELLTGTTPLERKRFKEAAFLEILRLIREEESPRPSTRLSTTEGLPSIAANRGLEPKKLSGLVRGELDWIVMKALDKDRNRRYETANGFAADVQHYLSDEPVLACPPSAAYRLRKFVKRNRGPVLAASLVLLAVLAGIAGTTWGWFEALSQRDDAVLARTEEAEQRRLALANAAEAKANELRAKDNEMKAAANATLASKQEKIAKDNETKAEWGLYTSHIASAQRELESHNVPLLYHYLNQCRPDFRGWEHDFLYTLANQNQQTLRGHRDGVYGVAFSPDGKLVASAAMGPFEKPGDGQRLPGEVKVWDAASGQVLRTLTVPTSTWIKSVAFSPDSKHLASASFGRGGPQVSEITIWDVASGQPLWTHKGQEADPIGGNESFHNVAFSPDGKRVATASRQHLLKMWDAATGKEVLTLKNEHKNSEGGSSVAFSPDSKRLAIASWSEPVKVLDAATGKELLTLKGHMGVVRNIAFSPDGKRLAGAGGAGGREVKVWDASNGEDILTLQGHTSSVYSVAFSPDGKNIVSGCADMTLKVWDAASGEVLLTLRGHTGNVQSVAFSPDGKRVASAAGDGTVKLWDLAGTRGILTLKGKDGVFAPDGKLATIVRQVSTVRVWDAATGQEGRTLLKDLVGGIDKMTFSPDGKRFAGFVGEAASGFQGKVWDAASGQELLTLKGHGFEGLSFAPSLTFSPDGKRLASISHQNLVKVWDAASGQELLTLKGHGSGWVLTPSLAFSPDGKRLATSAQKQKSFGGGPGEWPEVESEVKVWDVASGQEILTLKGLTGGSVAFSSDGKRLVSASSGIEGGFDPRKVESQVKVWDAASGQELLTLKGLKGVAFSPDGKRLASISTDLVKVWDAASGKELMTLKGHKEGVWSVAFSPDGKHLASISTDLVKVWDVVSGQEVLTLKAPGVLRVFFSPDGKRLASTDGPLLPETGIGHLGQGQSPLLDVKVWDTATGQEILTVKGSEVVFTPDGKLAATTHRTSILVWDPATGQEVPTRLVNLSGIFRMVALSPDGKYLATAADRMVKLWDAGSGKEVRTLMERTPEAYILSLGISPDGKRLASVIMQGVGKSLVRYTAKVWDTANGQEICSFQVHALKAPDDLDLNLVPYIDYMASNYRSVGDSVTFSPDGKRLTVLADFLSSGLGNFGMGDRPDFTQKVWDADTGQEVLTLKLQAPVRAVAFSPDGKRLATATATPGEVKLWDTASGQNLLTLNPDFTENDITVALVFSPDGKRLATASSSQNTVKVWDAASGQEVLTLRGHTAGVSSVAFSPDGKRLASADGGTVRLWDAASGQEVLTLRGHKETFNSVAFSPDGKRLAGTGFGGTTMIWDASKSMKEIGRK